MHRPRVLLADDHRMFAECLSGLLEPEFELVGVVGDGHSLLDAAARLDPDVIVTDITMPALNGLEAIERLQQAGTRAKVVVLTMQNDVGYARRALSGGAAGFVLKHSASDEVLTAIRCALEGRAFVTPNIQELLDTPTASAPADPGDSPAALTPRQREVFHLYAAGRTTAEVAGALGISKQMVETHKARILANLGLSAVADFARYASPGADEDLAAMVAVVVDDDTSRATIGRILERAAVGAQAYATSGAFLQRAAEGRCGCLILDPAAPGDDALSIVETVRQTNPALPIILVVDATDVATCSRAFRLGVFDLLERPLDEALLQQRVQAALASRAAPRAGQPDSQAAEVQAQLSAREKQVLEHLATGKTLKQIAALCKFSIQSAWKHKQNIFDKFQVQSEAELVRVLMSGKMPGDLP